MNKYLKKPVSQNIFLFVAISLIFCALVIPNRLSDINADSFFRLPLELLLLGLVLLVPGVIGKLLRWLAASVLAAGVIFKIADMATFNVFARPFNPIFDAYLLGNGIHLLKGALGESAALVVGVVLVALALLIIGLAFLLLNTIRNTQLAYAKPSVLVLVGLLVVWCGLRLTDSRYAIAGFYDLLAMHTSSTIASIRDTREFRKELNQTSAQASAVKNNPQLFAALKGKDVLIIFIESYGRTLLDKPEFAKDFHPFLQQQEQQLRDAGIAMRSAYLTSPTFGGLSWFAHGTAMSGLWINSQTRYDTLVMSDYPSINRLFNSAGWRTVAVMPAISMAWPEGNYFGYDQIYHAYNSGYQGKPFNWITMPDQFSLAAFQRNELDVQNRKPVMAEIALISSHAPWTPVPELVDWNQIGDGQIFNAQATSGDSPEEVWKDSDRVRLQFRLTTQYSISAVVDYLVHYANDNTVALVFGDHQPAPLVTGTTDNRDVPVHFFARDPKIIDAIAGWNWVEGMIPADHGPVWGMDEIKNKWIETFSH